MKYALCRPFDGTLHYYTGVYWSLDRAQAYNPATHQEAHDMAEDLNKKYPDPDNRVYISWVPFRPEVPPVTGIPSVNEVSLSGIISDRRFLEPDALHLHIGHINQEEGIWNGKDWQAPVVLSSDAAMDFKDKLEVGMEISVTGHLRGALHEDRWGMWIDVSSAENVQWKAKE